MGLPLQVELVRLQVNKFPKPELVEIASKLLIPSDQELCSTWVTIENYSHTVDELWVWAYLNKVRDCLNVPRYHNLNIPAVLEYRVKTSFQIQSQQQKTR